MSQDHGGTQRLDLSVFPPVATPDWDAAIRKDLKGADYDRRLVWRTDEGMTVRPFYREEDLAGLGGQLQAEPGAFPYVRGTGEGGWQTLEQFVPAQGAIRADLLLEGGATAVQQLGYALAEGVERVAQAVAAGRPVIEAARDVEFVFAVGGSYFVEIAKLRAARAAWAFALAAFDGVTASAVPAMTMLVRTARANKSAYDANTNLLRVTTEAMSAVLGGCQRLVVEPAGFEPRLAVSVQRVLREEASLGEVDDPAGGSYYVEALTDAMAREAWSVLQDVEGAGGYQAYVASGALRTAVERSRAAREKAMALRRRTMVGVNTFPNAMETAASTLPMPPEEDGSVPAWRLASAFERIRQRTEQHARATGKVPSVLLLTRGDLKMRMARANFSRNFFGCAGFTITESADLAPADAIVLCSSDPEYLAFVQDICARVAVPVIVAGNPVDQLDALRAAGVAGFVHAGSDAVATLTEWQDRLGLEALR